MRWPGWSANQKLPTNASAVSDAPHSWWAGRFAKPRGARPIQLFEGSRLWVGWTLWNLNRFWSQKPCQTRSFAKTLLSMFIDILLLCAMCVILPPAPSVVQEELRRVRIHAKASAAKRLRSNGLRGNGWRSPRSDFGLGHVRFAVIQEKAGRQLAFRMKIVSRRPAEFAG